MIEALAALYTEPHDFKTVVIDSVDWLEPLVWAKACRDNGWASIEDAGYGKGYVAALTFWRQYIDGLNALRDDRGMTVIQIAHTDIKRFDSPEHDPYDRYVIKLHTRAAALLQEHSDVVLFANYRISTVKADVGFNKKVNRALGSGERVHPHRRAPGLPRQEPLRPARDAAARLAGVRAGHARHRPADAPRPQSRHVRPTASPEGTTHGLTRPNLRRHRCRAHSTYEVLPPGKYLVQIVASEMRATKDGAGPVPLLGAGRARGQYAGRKLFDRLNLVNANPDTVEIAQRTPVVHLPCGRQDAGQQLRAAAPRSRMIADVRVRPPNGQYGESNSMRYLARVGAHGAQRGPHAGALGPRSPPLPPAPAPTPPPRRPALEAPGLSMTEHTVPAAPINMPETVIGCRKLLASLQDDIASIRVQIATNDIRRQTARKGLDPDWFHRARTALRLKQYEVAQVTVHLANLMRGVRHIHFKDTLIAGAARGIRRRRMGESP